ncbi:telomere end binding protein [Pochonia chlamydosporia 170]|uniref:Telomere end binding protein n=1 Tax=Pochonia chlamydosporia 170 TaxID=1380566 RepID=A0A179FGK9_METCM|nr:telomere end binding protein [Pochonia chlamydosporia 170]OAQ64391.1 telomere end binding protein [Pochonia chlamydosporia 170]
MADRPPLEALREAVPTPIAQLGPEIDDAKSRAIDGVVTVTWPYSIVTKSIAFILAEHDVLIRRNNGQIRIEFHGASGKAFADANVGGGDQLRISLDGAQWTRNGTKAGLPAGSLEWQLKFTNRLLLTIRRAESDDPDVIDVNVPEDDADRSLELPSIPRITPPVEAVGVENEVANSMPFVRPSTATVLSKRLASNTFEPEEFASPAFIKRARVSYGSLFEGDLDLFGDEKGRKKKNRRKSRFSMGNTVWRYSSRSPSQETKEPSEIGSLEDESTAEIHETAVSSFVAPASQQSTMVDEGCQTQELDFSPSMHVQVSAEAHFPGQQLAASPTAGYAIDNTTHLHTPSRNLFGNSQSHHEVPGAATEHMDSHVPTSQHHHGFDLGLPTTHVEMAPSAFASVSGPPDRIIAEAPTPEAVGVHDFPGVTLADHPYAEPAPHHDPNLHFHEDIHSTDHVFQHIPHQESDPWQPEAISSYPPVPNQHQDQHHTVAIDSSRVSAADVSRNTDFYHPQTAEEEEQTSHTHETFSRREEVLPDAEEEQYDSEDDGGDIKGEDYDLRNYEHTRDDDESESEEESDAPGSDVEQQAVDFEEEEDGDTSEEEEEEYEEEPSAQQRRAIAYRRQEEFEASEDGASAEDDSEEEGEDDVNGYDEDEDIEEEYDEEDEEEYDEEEEEVEEPPPPPRRPAEPVFISLLSDSEEEEEEKPVPTKAPQEVPADEMMHEDDEDIEEEAHTSEVEAAEQDIDEATTTHQPERDDKTQAEVDEESEPEADEPMDEPTQPATAVQDAEPEEIIEPQEEPDAMDVDEAASEPAGHADVEESKTRDNTAVEDVKDAPEIEAPAEEDAAEVSAAEEIEEATREADVEEQADAQESSAQAVEMPESVPAVDTHETAAKPDEAAAETEHEQSDSQKGETEDAKQNKQLPTPIETQSPEKTMAQQPAHQEDDDDAAAEDQIMSEYREYQSPTTKRPTEHVKPSTENEAPEPTQSQESDVLITVKSLRSHCHNKSHSIDSTSSRRDDPSIRLAQASSQAQDEPSQPEQDATQTSQGIRVTRSTKSDRDPSIQLAKASAEPSKPDETPSTVRVTRSMTEHSEEHHHQPGGTSKRPVTPETQHDEVLQSPSVSGSFIEDESLSALKRQLQRDLQTQLPDYIPLRSLRTSLNKTTDILAVATSTPPQPHRPKHGPRDYMLELSLTDPSSPSTVIIADIFRPHQASLPVVHKGDVVLLRRVTVVSMKGRGFGVRVGDASAWAVFEHGDEEMLPQIKGPPVEVADEEVEYAGGLRRWWDALDDRARGKIDRATRKVV